MTRALDLFCFHFYLKQVYFSIVKNVVHLD